MLEIVLKIPRKDSHFCIMVYPESNSQLTGLTSSMQAVVHKLSYMALSHSFQVQVRNGLLCTMSESPMYLNRMVQSPYAVMGLQYGWRNYLRLWGRIKQCNIFWSAPSYQRHVLSKIWARIP